MTEIAALSNGAPLLLMAAILLTIGAFAGILAGLLGVGGGIVLVPAFFYTFSTLGYGGPDLMRMCLATSLATIVVTSMRSVLSHHKKKSVDWMTLRSWAPGIIVGALVGVTVTSSLQTVTLQAIFGVLAIIVGSYMGLGRSQWRLGQEMPTGITRLSLSPTLGFLSVLMGIGGGSFGVPVLSLYGMPIHRAVATAAGFGCIIAIPSAAALLLVQMPPESRPPLTVGSVNLVAFGLVIAMTLITAPLGVKLAHSIDPKPLKRIFSIFLILVALNMLRKAFGY